LSSSTKGRCCHCFNAPGFDVRGQQGCRIVICCVTPYLFHIVHKLAHCHARRPEGGGLERFDRSTGLGCVAFKGIQLNKIPTTAAPTTSKPCEGVARADKPAKNQKPYPCLLTRAELKAIIAKQLG